MWAVARRLMARLRKLRPLLSATAISRQKSFSSMAVSKAEKAGRRAKLVSLLKAKMVDKYCSKTTVSVALRKQLEEIVDDVMSLIKETNVNKEALSRIDGRCKSAMEGVMRAQGKDPMYAKIAPKKKAPKDGKPKLMAPVSVKNDWVIMDTYEAIQNDKSIKADKKRLHDTKMSVRATLDKQMEEKREVARREKEIEDG